MSAKTMAKGMKTTKDTAQQAVAAPVKEMPLYVAEKDAVQEGRLVAEINMITEQTKQMLLFNSIEIGRRLTEAKSLVKHGEWANWLSERVNYSQRSANNFMKIYREYGESGLAANSQSIANLSVTQAIALLEAPSDERVKLAEQASEKDMTISELKAEVRRVKEELADERTSTMRALEQARKQHDEELARAEERTKEAYAAQQSLESQLKALRKEAAEAERANDEKAAAKVAEAVKQSEEQLKALNAQLGEKQGELDRMRKRHEEEIDLAKKTERELSKAEIARKDKELGEVKKRIGQLSKSLEDEQGKAGEVATLATARYAVDELMRSYERVADIVEGVGRFDKVASKKILDELDKGFAAIRKKSRAKLTK